MRAIWKGHIRFSLVTIPIRVYGAIEASETIRFNQVHRTCNGPVGYDKRCQLFLRKAVSCIARLEFHLLKPFSALPYLLHASDPALDE